jgi:hypothetical protein
MGFEPQQPCSKLESVNEFTEHMAQGLEEAKVTLTKVKDEYVMYYNQCQEPAPVFTQGDKVWLMEVTSLPTDHYLNCHTDAWACLLLTCVSVEVYTILSSLPISAVSTQSSRLASCPLHIQTPTTGITPTPNSCRR